MRINPRDFTVPNWWADPAAHVRVLGVDPSLRGLGMAAGQWNCEGQVQVETWTLTSPEAGHPRLDALMRAVTDAARDCDLVVIEGLAMASPDTNRAGAGLNWILRHELWRLGVPFSIVTPAQRALYATGKGNAAKDEVLLVVAGRYAPVAHVAGNDEADALVFLAMGARALGHPIETYLPERNLAAMAKTQWPA